MSPPDLAGAITPHATGAVLAITVIPRASRTAFAGLDAHGLRVHLTAPPVDGAANAALLTFLTDTLSVPRSSLSILTGHRNRRKRILIAGLTPDDLHARLTPFVEK